MATYNKITPEIAEQLTAVVGERRFFMGEDIDPNYSHDEMPIYGKYLPDAAVDVESTEEVSEIMKRDVKPEDISFPLGSRIVKINALLEFNGFRINMSAKNNLIRIFLNGIL